MERYQKPLLLLLFWLLLKLRTALDPKSEMPKIRSTAIWMLAAERGTSMAELIREALEEKVSSYRPRPRSLGLGASGTTDTAQLSGDERPRPRSWR